MSQEIKTDFLEALHQIQTSVGLVRGYAQLFSEENSSENREELEKEIDHLCMLIDQLSHLEQLHLSQGPIKTKPVKVLNILQETCQSFAPKRQHHQFQFSPNELNQRLTIASNEFYLKEILRVLLENAFKYTPTGHKVELKAQADDDHLQLSVSNEGVGIAPQYKDQIFQPFFRIPSGIPGSGLGLAIASRMAERLGYQLSHESDGRNYVTFSLDIPFSPSA